MSLVPSLLLVAAAVTGTVEVGDRSEIRVRDSNEPVGRVVDLETAPAATLRLHARTWEFILGYSPRLTLRQVDAAPQVDSLHHGTIAVAWRWPRLTLRLLGDLMWGTQSFTSLVLDTSPSSGPPPVDRLPLPSAIDYVSSRAGATARIAATRRWTLSSLIELTLGGGRDAASRVVMPLQSGPHGALSAEGALTRKDRLVSTLDASRAVFSSGPEDTVVEVTEAWRHTLSRRTASTLGGGAAGVASRAGGGDPLRLRAYPVAEAGLAHRIPESRVDALFSLRLAPVVDRLSGLVDERLQGAAALTWSLVPGTAIRGQLGAAQSIPWTSDGAFTVVLGEAAVTTRAGQWVRLELGTRGAWQWQRGAGTAPPQWVTFAGATVALPPLRF
jgi:hypothetical protein